MIQIFIAANYSLAHKSPCSKPLAKKETVYAHLYKEWHSFLAVVLIYEGCMVWFNTWVPPIIHVLFKCTNTPIASSKCLFWNCFGTGL